MVVQKKSLFKDWQVMGLATIGVVTLLASTLTAFTTNKIIHIKMDDFSESGLKKLTSQRKEHCLATSANLKTGDRSIQVQFAEIPEKISAKSVSNPMTDNICSIEEAELNRIIGQIGKVDGTSLSEALEMALILIQSERNSGRSNNIVLTITLDATETVTGKQPEDFIKVQSLLDEITAQNAVVRIMAVQGKLQQELQTIASGQPNVDVCTLIEIQMCVKEAFSQARTLKSEETAQD